MKKILSLVLSVIMLFGIIVFLNNEGQVIKGNESEVVEKISNKIIRFHVLANSNTDEDQKLKMKVKDKVIEFVTPKLKDSKSLDESRQILKENNKEIIELAKKVIKENGYDYSVTTSLGRENFPVKVYGNITLPQGEYEAFRILIGQAEGENWWCVMFPPLCFVDVTKGQISYDETESKMKEALSDEELEAVSGKNLESDKITFRFKIFDLLKDEK